MKRRSCVNVQTFVRLSMFPDYVILNATPRAFIFVVNTLILPGTSTWVSHNPKQEAKSCNKGTIILIGIYTIILIVCRQIQIGELAHIDCSIS